MTITLEIHDKVAQITFDDGKANAINPDWMTELTAAIDEAEAKAGALVLAGRQGIFSGGFDLKWLAANGLEKSGELLDQASHLLVRLYGGPKPVVAACTGHAIAMGAFLLLACDTRIAATGDFRFGANETVNNMILPAFGIALPRARLDNRRLVSAIIQAELYAPEDALDIGYVDRLVAPADVISAALETAAKLGQLPGAAYAGNKRKLHQDTIDEIEAAIGSY
ncbi:MAG: crotonase/enoyl-CoA hydratase family protein [Pseudomonadota bacterium]